jgi:hypothetical protein
VREHALLFRSLELCLARKEFKNKKLGLERIVRAYKRGKVEDKGQEASGPRSSCDVLSDFL